MDRRAWDKLRQKFTDLFKSKTREEWCTILEQTDTCFAPVLTMSEAAGHPHIKARDTVVEHEGVLQPAPAPRFSRTPGAISRRAAQPGQHTDEALGDWGFTADELAKLRDAGAIK
jgi:alpha-methylacyl-CoA racemase